MRLALWLAATLILSLAGCRTQEQGGAGQLFESMSDMNPAAAIPTKANLTLDKIDMPVEVIQTNENNKMTITLQGHGQTFETETYQVTNQTFSLLDAAGETYIEPLPLLKFPMKVGDTWNWSGKMTAGRPHQATAVISTSTDSINLPSSTATPSILVIVDLSIDSGAEIPATRKLRFWFVKDKGLVKRQFGIGTTREPSE